MENLLKISEFNSLSKEEQILKGLEITQQLINNTFDQMNPITIPDDLSSFTLLSMEVSPFPTESRKVMKFIETESLMKFINKDYFIQVDNYSVVFANQEDLSYHNFENILNLDNHFNHVQFQMATHGYIISKNENRFLQIFKISGSTQALLSLDQLNYYTIPLNNSQRGGRRLIFHSNQLSIALTKMITESQFFDKDNFSHVNTVFRLNNFAPGDKKFKAHYDTPFADKSNNLFSKYTMLIYLTGSGVHQFEDIPPLKIENFVLTSISENDCIIFDQKCEHEGNAYVDRNKIFIRTELIYKIENYSYDEKIARMFNMACYMTKELDHQQYSADLFNSCVRMRYGIVGEQVPCVYLMKKILNTLYVTDGNYFWFSTKIELKSIAMLIVLDYFNGKIQGLDNHKIQSKTLPIKNDLNEEEVNDELISRLLNVPFFPDDKVEEIRLKADTLSDFVPRNLCSDFLVFECECSYGDDGNIYSSEYFNEEKGNTVRKLQKILNENSVLIFDKVIAINQQQITIQMDDQQQSGKIRLSDFFINQEKRINFAGCSEPECECDHDPEYTKEEVMFYQTKKINKFCLPDISFQILPNEIVKLSIDMFHNGFIYFSTDSFEQPYTNRDKTMQNKKNDESRMEEED